MKTITLKTHGVTYELNTYTGAWAKSRERGVCQGTVRVIGKVLMHAWTIHGRGWRKPEVLWSPVDDKFNTHENAAEWLARVS